jgi:hypothetical protein
MSTTLHWVMDCPFSVIQYLPYQKVFEAKSVESNEIFA